MLSFQTINLFLLVFFANLKGITQPVSHTDSLAMANQFKIETEKWRQAYNSGKAENLVELYAPNAIYTSSHVPGLVAEGRERLIANFQMGMNMGGHIDSIEILSMELSCDLVTLFCKYKAVNNGVIANGRNLLVMRKINNRWLILMHMTVV